MTIIIGLTGLIGTGKSTVAKLCTKLGVPVHDADACVHALYENKDVQKMLARHFPLARQFWSGALDRTKLMNSLRKNPAKKALLNTLIHPLVYADQLEFIRQNRHRPVLILDVPLLFEAGMDRICDQIWVTYCSNALQKKRVLRRPGFTEEKFALIKKWQGNEKDKIARADLVINTGMHKARLVRLLKSTLGSYHA